MGHEDEFSLYIKWNGARREEFPDEDDCIKAMLRILKDRYHTKLFGGERGDFFAPLERRMSGSQEMNHWFYLDEADEATVPQGWDRDAPDYFTKNARLPKLGDDFYSRAGVIVPSLGRVYREASAPYLECATWTGSDPFELCRLVLRGQEIAARLAGFISTDEYVVQCFNAVSDRRGLEAKSCGMHDNHRMRRDTYDELTQTSRLYRSIKNSPWDIEIPIPTRMTRDFLSFKVLARILSGAGKIGHDCEDSLPAHYQISERANFIEQELGYLTTHYRPLLNLRDEPHADRRFWARLHDINGEGNRSPWSIIFGSGLTSIFLMALEDDAIDLDWHLAFPVRSFQALSRDLELNQDVWIIDRNGMIESTEKPLVLFGKILAQLQECCGRSSVPSWCATVVGEAQQAVGYLREGDPEGKASEMLDWKIKKRIIEFQMRRMHLDPQNPHDWLHPKLKLLDLSYHCLYGAGIRIWDNWFASGNVRDYARYANTELSDEALFNVCAAEETSAFVLSLLAADSNLRARSDILNWSVVELWNNSPEERVRIFLDDPAKFNKAFLSAGLEGNFDFSSESQRARLIEFLRTASGDIAQIRYSGELFS